MLCNSALANPHATRDDAWYCYKRLPVGVTASDPVYLDLIDDPADSPSLLPGDPNFPLVRQRWSKEKGMYVNAVGGYHPKPKVAAGKKLDTRKSGRNIRKHERLHNNMEFQPEFYKREAVYGSSFKVVKGPQPTRRQQREQADNTDEHGVIHQMTNPDPPRTAATKVKVTAYNPTMTEILSQFEDGKLCCGHWAKYHM